MNLLRFIQNLTKRLILVLCLVALFGVGPKKIFAAAPTALPSSTPIVTSTNDVQIKELPRTGLPIAGLALTALVPMGIIFRKFGNKALIQYSASSIWTNREFLKN